MTLFIHMPHSPLKHSHLRHALTFFITDFEGNNGESEFWQFG